MRIAITGATGFLGHYVVSYLASQGHLCRCWYRPSPIFRNLTSAATRGRGAGRHGARGSWRKRICAGVSKPNRWRICRCRVVSRVG
jgi:uncharacterized protein YbjT (DUF2867 family)